MCVSTDQSYSLADDIVSIPTSELDALSDLIDWSSLEGHLKGIQRDYSVLSLFKILLLQTWHNLSDASVSDALHRDLVFMHFCGFSLEGKKPDAATICRFRQKLIQKKCLDSLLTLVNESLEQQDLKLSEGEYVSSDATLIKSARRPRKHPSTEETEAGHYEVDGVAYSDDTEASWLKKGKESTYGYSSTVMTDEEGLVLSVNTHPANQSEMSRFSEDIDESVVKEGQKVLYDKGAASQRNRKHLKEKGLRDGIMQKKPKGKVFTPRQKLRNKLISTSALSLSVPLAP